MRGSRFGVGEAMKGFVEGGKGVDDGNGTRYRGSLRARSSIRSINFGSLCIFHVHMIQNTRTSIIRERMPIQNSCWFIAGHAWLSR